MNQIKNQLKMTCPICKKICRTPHYKSCYNALDKNNAFIKTFEFSYIRHNFIIEQYNEGVSILELSQSNNISYQLIQRYFSCKNIITRGLSLQSGNSHTRLKYKNTCLLKYNTTNVSKSTIIKNKKKETFTKNYGVDNIFKTHNFGERATEIMLKLYGVKRKTNGKKQSLTKSKWSEAKKQEVASKIKKSKSERTDEQNYNSYVLNSSNSCFKINKVETKIAEALIMCGLPHTFSKFVGGKSYDFYIHTTKILIEVQGDYWHANPLRYKSTDIIKYPGNVYKTAQQVWDYDKHKRNIAEKWGYILIEIWEDEIRKLTIEDICSVIASKIGAIHPPQKDHLP